MNLKSKKNHSVRYDIETASSVGTRVWKVYSVTLKIVNPLSFSSQKSKIGFLKDALANFVKLTSNESATCKLPVKCVFFDY